MMGRDKGGTGVCGESVTFLNGHECINMDCSNELFTESCFVLFLFLLVELLL